ncbi:hypothetical protein XENOCAPTIV_013706 [Xenoophorus captivus]|uniref:Uncharacterized protein n=1 Tax=Xenoophorus captivus TaxID=1517983 RepID=A0ABV0RKR4_9TELE
MVRVRGHVWELHHAPFAPPAPHFVPAGFLPMCCFSVCEAVKLTRSADSGPSHPRTGKENEEAVKAGSPLKGPWPPSRRRRNSLCRLICDTNASE